MPIFIWIFSNGQVWFSKEPKAPAATSTYTLVSAFRINSAASAQKITTLGGTVSSSLTATGGTGATLTGGTSIPYSGNPTSITELT